MRRDIASNNQCSRPKRLFTEAGIAYVLGTIILLILVLSMVYPVQTQSGEDPKIVAYGRGCLKCFTNYVNSLRAELSIWNITEVEIGYLDSDPEAAKELEELREKLGVPKDIRTEIVVIVNDVFVFENSFPVGLIADFVVNHTGDYDSIVVAWNYLQDVAMIPDKYGELRFCSVEYSISECIEPTPRRLVDILWLVFVSGLLDGVNPCAFAVLLFFIAVLFTSGSRDIRQNHGRKILVTGAIYILAVFLAYLVIGVAYINIVAATPYTHLISKGGGILVIFLGFLSVKDYFFPGLGPSLGIPKSLWETIRRWMHRFSLPATFVVGLMVGLFEFPCTGGIYLAILGLLALNSTFIEGFIYLLLYNLAFVLPLIIILVVASNKRMVRFSLSKWKNKEHRIMKLVSGLVMVSLGVFLLFFGFV